MDIKPSLRPGLSTSTRGGRLAGPGRWLRALLHRNLEVKNSVFEIRIHISAQWDAIYVNSTHFITYLNAFSVSDSLDIEYLKFISTYCFRKGSRKDGYLFIVL